MTMLSKFLSLTMLSMITIVGAASVTQTHAATYEVRMLNKDSAGKAWQFDPPFLSIAPGDTVRFVPVNPGHNSESIVEVSPSGSVQWKGRLNEELSVTYDVQGTYAYKCLPHAALGMVGVIQVGAGDAAVDWSKVSLPEKGKARLNEILRLDN